MGKLGRTAEPAMGGVKSRLGSLDDLLHQGQVKSLFERALFERRRSFGACL